MDQASEGARPRTNGAPGRNSPLAANGVLRANEVFGANGVLRPNEALGANEVRASALPSAAWRKSSFSNPSGNCVEAADLTGGMAVRNSRFPDGPALVFTEAEWEAFLRGVKAGEFG